MSNSLLRWPKSPPHPDQARADAKARAAGHDKAYFIDDAWGGYWQARTESFGPWTFQLEKLDGNGLQEDKD